MKQKVSQIFNICNIYLLIWVLYAFHWHMTGRFPLVEKFSNALLGLNLVVSIYYFFYVHIKYYLPKVLYALDFLLGLLVIYGICSIMFGGDIVIKFSGSRINNASFLIGALRSFLPFYAFYAFSLRGWLSEKSVKIWGAIIMLQYLFIFTRSSRAMAWGLGNYVSGSAYLFSTMFPYVFLLKGRKIWGFAGVAFISLMVLFGVKRGAILIAVLFILYYIWMNFKNSTSVMSKVGVLVVVSAFLFVGVKYVSDFYERSSYFQRRVEQTEEGGASGRDQIASNIWRVYSTESNIWQMLFGYGADGSLKVGVNYAHNDWLEVLIDMGLVGFVAYLVFWISLILQWKRLKYNRLMYAILGGAIVVMLPRSMFSMLFSNLEVSISMLMSYVLALSWQKQNLLENRAEKTFSS